MIRFGDKYQHLIGRAGCACCGPETQAALHRVMATLSRPSRLAKLPPPQWNAYPPSAEGPRDTPWHLIEKS
jgi:hypothetical protein